jgi:hypothetical protein
VPIQLESSGEGERNAVERESWCFCGGQLFVAVSLELLLEKKKKNTGIHPALPFK